MVPQVRNAMLLFASNIVGHFIGLAFNVFLAPGSFSDGIIVEAGAAQLTTSERY